MTRTVTTTAQSTSSDCEASDLTGTFAVVPGSAGAGNIVYSLKLTNASSDACTIGGVPEVQLLDASHDDVETRSTGTPSGATPTLQPGASATAEARFSPDVSPCGKTVSHYLRVTAPGGGTLDVPIAPPTTVCDGGAMVWTSLTTAS